MRRWLPLAALVLLAAAVRIGAIAYTNAADAPAEENRIIARNLADGRGFTFTEFGVTGPTAIRGPVYPMLVAALGPDRVGVLLAFNVVAGALSVITAAALTKRLLSPLPTYGETEPEKARSPMPVAAWIAAGAFAVWPTQVYAATLTQGLTLAILLTLTCLALAWRHTAPSLIAAGLLAGLAALTEPVLALPLLLAAAVLGWRRHWPDAALFVATAMVLVSPWLYRNAVIFGRPMPITSNFWRDAYLGNGPDTDAGRAVWDDTTDGSPGLVRRVRTRIDLLSPRDYDRLKAHEPDRTDTFRQWATEWISAHPAHYAYNVAWRSLSAWTGSTDHPLAVRLPYTLSRAIAAGALAFWLLSATRATWPWLGTGLLMAGGLLLSTMWTIVEVRSAVLMDVPQLILLAAVVAGIDLRDKLSTHHIALFSPRKD